MKPEVKIFAHITIHVYFLGITSSRRSVLAKEFPAELVEKPRKSPDEPISKKV
jgi:hypothetical protein